ncbi:MAG TPA: CCA tRNA nucleotidyltransferase [Pirellulales bacterium]|nr:CCA tRNA nucleotidyltransferase [Pirellulales bacterium]
MPDLDPQRQRDFAVEVVQSLRDAGFEAYWAGGCVRDTLIGRRPKDYDVATNATPPAIRTVFRHRKTLEIGEAFGVVAVVGPKSAGTVEVTTFRHDAPYSDGRHPDAVTFSNAQDDAQRRDFTINGLFYDPFGSDEDRRVIDYVGGVEDLARRMVRAIGDPRARFAEDKLRLLRAVRFAATFAFDLDGATEAAMRELAGQVTTVSPERIAQEMRTLLVHPGRARGVELLRQTGLLAAVLPEAAVLAEAGWRRTLAVLGNLREASFPLALAVILSALADAAGLAHGAAAKNARGGVAEQVGRRWKLSNDERERARWLVEHRTALAEARILPWSQLQPLVIRDGFEELVALHEADAAAAGRNLDDVVHCRALMRRPHDQLDPLPLVTGDDLIRHGVPQGKIYKEILDRVRAAQLDDEIATRLEALALVDRLRAEGA